MPTKALYGRYLEDFRVGEVIEHWPGRTVTEADDMLFCMLTMNHHPLHSDAKYAADTQFGQRIVAGPLVYSLVFGMTVAVVSGKAIANLATSEMRHLAPVFHGDTLYARTEPHLLADGAVRVHRSPCATPRASPTAASSASRPRASTRRTRSCWSSSAPSCCPSARLRRISRRPQRDVWEVSGAAIPVGRAPMAPVSPPLFNQCQSRTAANRSLRSPLSIASDGEGVRG